MRKSAMPLATTRNGVFGMTILALTVAFSGSNAAAEPTFPKDLQGEWHVLLGLPATQLGTEDEDAGLIGGQVTIEADRLTLKSPGEQAQALLTADCKLLAEQRVDEKRRPRPGREAEVALSGKVTGSRRLIWATSSQGLMHVKILTSEPTERGRYQSDAWGPGADTLYLALRRQSVPPQSKHDAAADAKRIVGEWTAVAHYDDAFLKEPWLLGALSYCGACRVVGSDRSAVRELGRRRRGPDGPHAQSIRLLRRRSAVHRLQRDRQPARRQTNPLRAPSFRRQSQPVHPRTPANRREKMK